ncbi:MAG: GNAT superfamily N-acetyltransferase [Verrucomicrobiales bacterium]|jgi:GNAT superfamily N-acetyltransferase
MSAPKPKIRLATKSDIEDLASLAALASLGDEMERETKGLSERLFGKGSQCRALVADLGGPIVGVAHFHHFATALAAKPSLWLDDIFVVDDYRSEGIGQQLLLELGQICRQENYAQIDFTASSLSPKAIRFYRRLGAKFFNEPRYGRLTAEAMKAVQVKKRARKMAARKRKSGKKKK